MMTSNYNLFLVGPRGHILPNLSIVASLVAETIFPRAMGSLTVAWGKTPTCTALSDTILHCISSEDIS